MKELNDRQLAATFKAAIAMWEDMRKDGTPVRECAKALERSLRAAWPQTDEREWPHWARVPRCMHCNGYGLIIRTVTNRLGCVVDEGTPCSCHLGAKYHDKPKAEADYTAAGKTAAKPKTFSRWNG